MQTRQLYPYYVYQITNIFRNNAKAFKKFTLRPAKLVVGRPVSPDSPSLGIGEECGDVHNSIPNSPDSRTLETGKDYSSIKSDDVFEEGTINAAQVNYKHNIHEIFI